MPTSYIELAIAADPVLFDELVARLTLEGIEGFWEDGPVLRAYVRSSGWSAERFREIREAADTLAAMHSAPTPVITAATIQPQNWNKDWEASIAPIKASSRIVIRPSWHTGPLPEGDIVLTIDPKMSFGTGYHETTRLMLKLLENHIAAGMRMLDVGTGTGVLAIAAIKLGASSAVGVDNDEWSYDNARENIVQNGVDGKVRIIHGELGDVHEDGFNLVAANIQWNVIAPLLPALNSILAPGGILLLSGLLRSDRDTIIESVVASGCTILEEATEHEWLAFALYPSR